MNIDHHLKDHFFIIGDGGDPSEVPEAEFFNTKKEGAKMGYDFNNAAPQQDFGDLIPPGTIARLKMEVRFPSDPAKAGDEPALTKSQSSDAQYLDCEFTILSEPLKGRKFWQNVMAKGVSQKALDISVSTFRALLESSRNINPTDMSDLGLKARKIKDFGDFNGIEFAGKIGFEKGKDGYDDKNKIQVVITPDKPEYRTAMSGQTTVGKPITPSATPANKPPVTPAWAAPEQTQQPTQAANASPAASTVPDWAR